MRVYGLFMASFMAFYELATSCDMVCNRTNPAYNPCLMGYKICNGIEDCADGSDENPEFCENWSCSANYVKCKSNVQCIKISGLCEDPGSDRATRDCEDGSDEDEEWCGGECIFCHSACFCRIQFRSERMQP